MKLRKKTYSRRYVQKFINRLDHLEANLEELRRQVEASDGLLRAAPVSGDERMTGNEECGIRRITDAGELRHLVCNAIECIQKKELWRIS